MNKLIKGEQEEKRRKSDFQKGQEKLVLSSL
jgi:hypothetical protein